MKVKAEGCSALLVCIKQTTLYHIPEDRESERA